MVQPALRGHIQPIRLRNSARAILLTRVVEGTGCWAILFSFFRGVTVNGWLVDAVFAAYFAANVLLYFRQRREEMTPALIWLDLAVNLLTMAAAAHWSGGLYSPLMAVFVINIGTYGMIFGVDVGLQSLAATGLIAIGLAIMQTTGFGSADAIEEVPLIVRQRLSLVFAGMIFTLGCIGAMRFFRILEDRERRLAEAVQEMDRLYHESLRHQEHLRHLSRRMMQVSEHTMRRLARELHDDLGQALTAIKMDLGFVDRELPGDSPVRPQVRQARNQVVAVLQSVRNLSQLLRPAALDDLGLVAAIQSYIRNFSERTRIVVSLDAPTTEMRLPPPIEVALYRVLQEALTNVARHAAARHVDVELEVSETAVTLSVVDDGRGFDAATALQSQIYDRGLGVIGMRERVALYGGRFAIESRPGEGTRVELTISLPFEAPEDERAEDSRLVG
jgi:signal transduction histidine kinase